MCVLLGGEDLLEKLRSNDKMKKNKNIRMGLGDMELLFKYIKVFGIDHVVSVRLVGTWQMERQLWSEDVFG